MKIFLGLDDTCGYYSRLEAGFANLGVETELVVAYPSRQYPRIRKCSFLGTVVEYLGWMRLKNKDNQLMHFLYSFSEAISLLLLLIYELVVCDIFFFAGGVTFLRGVDLPLYRLFRKKVIIIFHGSDSRPPYLNGAYVLGSTKLTWQEIEKMTRKVYKHVRFCEKYATHVVQLPYTGHFHSKQFINFLAIGIPSEYLAIKKNAKKNNVFRVLHAPTRPLQKGTPIIVETIERLRAEGYSIELVVMVNKKPVEVFDAIEDCDLVVDELYSDTPLAGFGSEAMARGKAVVVGVSEAKALLESIPSDMVPPSLICSPSSLYDCLRHILIDGNVLDYFSEMGIEFVKHLWSQDNVAKRYIALISGRFPESWNYDPYELRYISGWGLSSKELEKALVLYAYKYGLTRMLLNDKPRILARVQEIINLGPSTLNPECISDEHT